MADYRVNLDMFAGPLDLLLYLVRKEEVDIYDIPIAKITDQYLSYVELLKSFDMDLAGDFLVMAATLMQIKSAMLLPKATPDQISAEDFGDPRAELIRQLLEYKKYKDAANLLNEAADEQKMRFSRPNTVIEGLRPNAEPQVDIELVSIWDLLEAFDTIMKATGAYFDISHIKDDTPIDLYQIEILSRLQSDGPTVFERIFESADKRIKMIGLFLALLELIRDKLIWAEQPENSNTIYLRALTDEPAEQAVKRVIAAAENALEEKEAKQPAKTELKPERAPIEIAELPAKSMQNISTEQVKLVSIPIIELPAKDKSDSLHGQKADTETEQLSIEEDQTE